MDTNRKLQCLLITWETFEMLQSFIVFNFPTIYGNILTIPSFGYDGLLLIRWQHASQLVMSILAALLMIQDVQSLREKFCVAYVILNTSRLVLLLVDRTFPLALILFEALRLVIHCLMYSTSVSPIDLEPPLNEFTRAKSTVKLLKVQGIFLILLPVYAYFTWSVAASSLLGLYLLWFFSELCFACLCFIQTLVDTPFTMDIVTGCLMVVWNYLIVLLYGLSWQSIPFEDLSKWSSLHINILVHFLFGLGFTIALALDLCTIP